MSNYLRKIKKRIEQERSDEEKRVLAVAEWSDQYQHKYPTFFLVSADPVQALLSLMKQHGVSVVKAAELSEEFAVEWKKDRDD